MIMPLPLTFVIPLSSFIHHLACVMHWGVIYLCNLVTYLFIFVFYLPQRNVSSVKK